MNSVNSCDMALWGVDLFRSSSCWMACSMICQRVAMTTEVDCYKIPKVNLKSCSRGNTVASKPRNDWCLSGFSSGLFSTTQSVSKACMTLLGAFISSINLCQLFPRWRKALTREPRCNWRLRTNQSLSLSQMPILSRQQNLFGQLLISIMPVSPEPSSSPSATTSPSVPGRENI